MITHQWVYGSHRWSVVSFWVSLRRSKAALTVYLCLRIFFHLRSQDWVSFLNLGNSEKVCAGQFLRNEVNEKGAQQLAKKPRANCGAQYCESQSSKRVSIQAVGRSILGQTELVRMCTDLYSILQEGLGKILMAETVWERLSSLLTLLSSPTFCLPHHLNSHLFFQYFQYLCFNPGYHFKAQKHLRNCWFWVETLNSN